MDRPVTFGAPVPAPELERLRRRLLRHARFAVRDAAAAEDLVQDTLLDVVQGAHRHRGESTLATWAGAILRHKVADWYRAPARRVMVPAADGAGATPAAAVDSGLDEHGARQPAAPRGEQPEEQEERRQLLLRLQQCMGCLPERLGRVFVLRNGLGFETVEIARRLNLSLGNVRQILHRARLGLRGCMQDPAPPHEGGRRIRTSAASRP